MILKLERIFYYPVLVFGTVAAFGLLSSEFGWLSSVAFACVALMWARPFLPMRAERFVRFAFYVVSVVLLIATWWIGLWAFGSFRMSKF